MRNLFFLVLVLAISCGNSMAQEKSSGKAALTDAERARIKTQVESLKKNKLEAAEVGSKNVKAGASRQEKEIDERLKKEHEHVDKLSTGSAWMYGPGTAHVAGQARKEQLSAAAAAEKQKIAKEAQLKAARQTEAANKAAESVNQSVEGLKSQVAKDGKFGLQPKGSNLHVRQYNKN